DSQTAAAPQRFPAARLLLPLNLSMEKAAAPVLLRRKKCSIRPAYPAPCSIPASGWIFRSFRWSHSQWTNSRSIMQAVTIFNGSGSERLLRVLRRCLSDFARLLELHQKRGEIHDDNPDNHTTQIDPVDQRLAHHGAVTRNQFADFPDNLKNGANANRQKNRRQYRIKGKAADPGPNYRRAAGEQDQLGEVPQAGI